MDKLVIRDKTRQGLLQYCTVDLIERVFSHVGANNITVDKSNMCKNMWEITHLLQVEHEELLDNLKVIYVFYKLGGTLIYEGRETQYPVLFRLIDKNEPNAVLLYWAHNEANDVKPIYDKGEIEIPKIMPRYVCTKVLDDLFFIEKWVKGKYVTMKGGYTSREACEKEVQELNQKYEANE